MKPIEYCSCGIFNGMGAIGVGKRQIAMPLFVWRINTCAARLHTGIFVAALSTSCYPVHLAHFQLFKMERLKV